MTANTASARITSIDGYRAFAIGAVVLHHAFSAPGFPAWLVPVAHLLPRGVVGFWVLSGFLITRSLLLDEQRNGRIELRSFYPRQAIRYFPPMLAYLLVVGVLIACRVPGFDWWLVIRPAILDPNTFCIAESVSHLYSLVLQIYFWLVWPVVLKGVRPRFRFHAALLLALTAFAWRSIGQSLAMDEGGCAGRIDFFFAGPLVGCCFAIAAPSLSRLVRQASKPVCAVMAAAAVTILILTANPAGLGIIPPQGNHDASYRGMLSIVDIYALVVPIAVYLSWGCLVFLLVNDLLPAVSRFLSWKGLTWLGRISFSVYLWQNLFCQGLTETRLDYFPVNILASIGCGYIAYRLIELPSLRWRSRIKRNSAISPEIQPASAKA